MDKLVIRPATASDLPELRQAVAELQDYERGLHATRLPGEQIADAYLAWLQHQAAEQSGAVLTAEIDGSFAGFVVGWLDVDAVRRGLRALSAVALVAAALVAFGALRDPGSRIGRLLWPRLAPIGRRFLPVTSVARALGFGMVWGWMPCGFVYTVMLIAALEQDALRSAATMLAFGVGTAPAMIAVAFGAQRGARFASGAAGRRVAGAVLIGSAALTLFAPQIVAAAPWLDPWMPYLCRVDAR